MHASVYKCFKKQDIAKKNPFAVKIVREDDDEKIEAHKKEYEITHTIKHPNIVYSIEIFVNNAKKEIH